MQKLSFRRTPLATGVALALGATVMSPAVAQEEVIEEIVAVGIRGSLQSSMVQKRDAQGVSDGVIAEDIGKFPDTNLAESMQRITGVSIDRSTGAGSAPGEGSRVTVRGVGPDFNLVTLNGRQMPGTTLEGTVESSSRSFDFANLASEAVSAINVYKTSMARLPSGGMGATIDIRTARPLDNPDRVASVGAKYVMDSSVENGDSGTPEISGIFSNTSADGRFGVAVSGSYQERNLGYNQAGHGAGWRQNFGGLNDSWTGLPAEGSNGTTTTNRPTDSLYLIPQNIAYTFNDVQRERTNGQLVLQFAPTDTITATLDYTYAQNEIKTQLSELSAWNGFSPTVISSFTDGPVAVPTSYNQVQDPNDPGNPDPAGDFGGNQGDFGTNHELNSLGLNLAWDPSDKVSFALDFHDSESDSGPAGKWGSSNAVGWFSFNRGTTGIINEQDFPVMGIEFAPGTTSADVSQVQTTGSSFRTSNSTASIQEFRLSGSYFFDNDAYSLDFGVMTNEIENQSTFARIEVASWGGSGESPDDYDDSLFRLDNVAPYFSGVPGAGDGRLTPEFFRLTNFDAAIAAARGVLPGDRWNAPTGPADPRADTVVDKRTTEETTAAYVQFNAGFDIGDKPANIAAGLRWEQTDVVSSALVPIYTAITWNSANEYSLISSGQGFTNLKGDYDYVLPSIDFNVELTEDVILRLGYSETIGRPGWDQIQGGQTLSSVRQAGGAGEQGDPGLLPLESTNIDLSVEWYYGSGSYLSVAYFNKSIDNYVSFEDVSGTPFNLPHPAQGARFAEADAATGGTGDVNAIRQYIFENYADTPEVTITGTDSSGNFTGTIAGVLGEDPATVFDVSVPTNAAKSGIDGWEIALQHFFGDTGFGVSANYTIVNADDEYDDTLVDAGGVAVQQFAVEGVSDSANLIAFFENDKWSTRLAYNWRDEYLTNRSFGGGGQVNPEYVEEYGQWDGNVSYNVNDQLTVIFEAINITDEYNRSYVRAPNATGFLTTTGARYMIGARYDFE